MRGRSLETLGELLKAYRLFPSCRNHHCARNGPPLDSAALLARFGAGGLVDDVVRRLRCSTCGAPGEVRIVWAQGPDGSYPRSGQPHKAGDASSERDRRPRAY